MIKKNLFSEAIISISHAKVKAANPYTPDLAGQLVPKHQIATKHVVANLVKVFGEQQSTIRNNTETQPGFSSFVETLKKAFSASPTPVLGDYDESMQTKLAKLVAFAYYQEYEDTMKNNPKGNNFRAIPDEKKAITSAEKLLDRLVVLGLRTLETNVSFTEDLGAAVAAVLWDSVGEEAAKKKPAAEVPKQEDSPAEPPVSTPSNVQPPQPQAPTAPEQAPSMPLAAGRSYANLRLKKPFGLLD